MSAPPNLPPVGELAPPKPRAGLRCPVLRRVNDVKQAGPIGCVCWGCDARVCWQFWSSRSAWRSMPAPPSGSSLEGLWCTGMPAGIVQHTLMHGGGCACWCRLLTHTARAAAPPCRLTRGAQRFSAWHQCLDHPRSTAMAATRAGSGTPSQPHPRAAQLGTQQLVTRLKDEATGRFHAPSSRSVAASQRRAHSTTRPLGGRTAQTPACQRAPPASCFTAAAPQLPPLTAAGPPPAPGTLAGPAATPHSARRHLLAAAEGVGGGGGAAGRCAGAHPECSLRRARGVDEAGALARVQSAAGGSCHAF